MTPMQRLFCALGVHAVDLGDIERRRRRMCRQGVVATGKLPCHCTRCGRMV